ncbi:DUF2958 domain-containing protein [Sphingopyxis granuli]|uniref:DUF2958 domain-containing protein n=1 Tax=Sphingopyxis granuli TaxID=267128 RepID=UPI001BB0C419
MQLITDTIRAQLIANGRLSIEHPEFDPKPVVKLFTPDAGATWLISECDPQEPDILYGLCDPGLGEPELGTVMPAGAGVIVGAPGIVHSPRTGQRGSDQRVRCRNARVDHANHRRIRWRRRHPPAIFGHKRVLPQALVALVKERLDALAGAPHFADRAVEAADEPKGRLGCSEHEYDRGFRKLQPVGIHVEPRLLRGRHHRLHDRIGATQPKLPPLRRWRCQVRRADDERARRTGADRLDHLEFVDVGTLVIAEIFGAIGRDPAGQECASVIGNEHYRPLCAILATLGTEDDDLLRREIQRRYLRGLGALARHHRLDLDENAAFQPVDRDADVLLGRREVA